MTKPQATDDQRLEAFLILTSRPVSGSCLFLLYRIADLRHELVRVLCFMRADMIDVEHRLRRFIPVRLHPCNDSSVNICDLGIASLIGTAGDRHLRKSRTGHRNAAVRSVRAPGW